MADGISATSSVFPATDPARAGASAPQGAAQPGKAQGTGQAAATGDSLTLSPEAKREVAKLQSRDAAVRAHEAAHIAAGGSLVTSGATFTYERGPDGRAYAIGGEVSIDTSPVRGNPQATITKAAQIEAAALAPVDPSGQDEAVAAQAAAMSAQAAAQLGTQSSQAPGGSAGQAATGAAKAGASAATNGPTGAPSAAGSTGAPAQTPRQVIAAITGEPTRAQAFGGNPTSQAGISGGGASGTQAQASDRTPSLTSYQTYEQAINPATNQTTNNVSNKASNPTLSAITGQAAGARAYAGQQANQTGSRFSAYA